MNSANKINVTINLAGILRCFGDMYRDATIWRGMEKYAIVVTRSHVWDKLFIVMVR